jgi:hypothetical protein
MPAPGVVAVGIAAARAIGGILGKGSKNVNPVYKNIGEPKSAVKVVKSSPGNVDRMNKQRTSAGRARELAAARRAEQIRTAKANARLTKIKEGK